jgi:subtilase family serine protease
MQPNRPPQPGGAPCRRIRSAILAVLLAGATAFAWAQAADRITATVDDNHLTLLRGNISLRARPEFDRGRVPDNLPQQHILMMLRRSEGRREALEQFIAAQYEPGSADFHRWLTPQQIGAEFGPAAGDIRKVTQWLTQHGFTINNVPASGLFVDFSGTAGQVAQAFHTEIHRYPVNGKDHYANAGDPSIPTALAPVVSGFRALNDFHPQPQVRHLGVAHLDRSTRTWLPAAAESPHLTATANSLYVAGPQDFARIYGVDQVWQERMDARSWAPPIVGTGQTIGVVGESDLESADIQSFRDQFGITALGPHGMVEMENPPASACAAPDPSDNEPESYLDAEWSGAMAPDATIDFVACGEQGVTAGVDLAAAYIIGDAAHVQRISVLSTSYGDCEAVPQSEANQFYVSLWQQAAAEGITVVAAAGDTGGDGCHYEGAYASDGLSVLSEASTPYNIAAGGTDFSDVFSGTTSTYWAAANGADFLSALSYIPEMTWNDSCASPLVLAHFGQGFDSSSGPNGFCTWAEQQPVDPNLGFAPFANAFAGSGGLSTVSARPSWQSGVPGIPQQGGRAVPDIAMFAAGGFTWSQTLILCDSGLENMPPGTACDFSNANDVFANYGGGTSFVAPAFAGIMALIDQKSGDRQGQANYVLYPLAAEQYVSYSSATQPSLANCAAYLGTQALSGCYFHDISATPTAGASSPFITSTTAVPCTGTATSAGTFTDTSTDPASDNENCDGYQITVSANGSSLTTTPDYYGVLSTGSSSAFAATPGYDLATGLGSPNVYSLVNAPQWSGGGLATNVTLTLSQPTVAASQNLTMLATVADQGRLPVLGGTVTFYSGNTVLGSVTQACSLRGVFGLEVAGSGLGGDGTYANVFASYAGGAQKCRRRRATYYGSQSAPATLVVSQSAGKQVGKSTVAGRIAVGNHATRVAQAPDL